MYVLLKHVFSIACHFLKFNCEQYHLIHIQQLVFFSQLYVFEICPCCYGTSLGVQFNFLFPKFQVCDLVGSC